MFHSIKKGIQVRNDMLVSKHWQYLYFLVELFLQRNARLGVIISTRDEWLFSNFCYNLGFVKLRCVVDRLEISSFLQKHRNAVRALSSGCIVNCDKALKVSSYWCIVCKTHSNSMRHPFDIEQYLIKMHWIGEFLFFTEINLQWFSATWAQCTVIRLWYGVQ